MNFWRRGKTASQPEQRERSQSGASLHTIQPDTFGWEAQLAHNTHVPQTPLCVLRRDVLVVTLGKSGAVVMDKLVQRMEDTYLSPGNAPHLLHLDMLHARDNTGFYLPTSSSGTYRVRPVALGLEEPRTFPVGDAFSNPNQSIWEWARIRNSLAGTIEGTHRARVILCNHLERNPSPLVNQIRTYREVQEIYLVASLAEYVGASLVGDLAVLFKTLLNQAELKVNALVMEEAEPDGGFSLQHRSGTLYELAWLQQPGHVRSPLPARVGIYNQSNQRALVLDSNILFRGDIQSGEQQVINAVWSVLLSPNFALSMNTAAAPLHDHQPLITLAESYSVSVPLRLYRSLIAALTMKEVLGNNSTPPVNTADAPAIVLDDIRHQGLLPCINYLQLQTKISFRTPLLPLIHSLKAKIADCDRAITNLRIQIEGLRQEKRGDAQREDQRRTETPSLLMTRWLSESTDIEALRRAVFRRVGWRADGNLLYLVVDDGDHAKVLIEDNESFSDAFTLIESLVDQLVWAQIRDSANALLSPFKGDANARDRWNLRFARWFNRTPQNAEHKELNLHVAWQPDGFTAQSFHDGHMETLDPSFAAHVTLYTKVHFDYLQLGNVDAPQQPTPVSKVFLAHLHAYIGSDLLGTEAREAPVDLLYALTHRRAFYWYYRAWRSAALPDLQQRIDPDMRLSVTQSEFLWRFIRQFEAAPQFRDEIRTLIETQTGSADNPMPDLPTDTPFERSLRPILEGMSNQLPAYFTA